MNVNTSTPSAAVVLMVSALILIIAIGGLLGCSLAGILVGAGMSVAAGHD